MATQHIENRSIDIIIPADDRSSLTLNLTINVADAIEDENGVRQPVQPQASATGSSLLNARSPHFGNIAKRTPQLIEDENGARQPVPPSPATGSSTPNTGLSHFGNLFKRTTQLSPGAEAQLDRFCNTENAEERDALQYVLLLEIRDLFKQTHRPGNWTLSDELKKTIGSYVKAFLLSPNITAYRGNCAEQILKAMEDLNVADLPPEKGVLQVNEVLSSISNQLTSFRAVIKQKIQASLGAPNDKAAPTRNVADLTHALIAHTAVPPTLQLWMRVAFLRHCLVTCPTADYWMAVDETLARARARSADSIELSNAFGRVYAEDVRQYGDPATTRHASVPLESRPGWLRTIDGHAMEVKAPASAGGV
ncbi:hypothetical protein BJ912DRAFT_646907 [Pholiota molesta]|nr:hypothetical protein BJ912DRAFT_646907 [Pholiota molesta]